MLTWHANDDAPQSNEHYAIGNVRWYIKGRREMIGDNSYIIWHLQGQTDSASRPGYVRKDGRAVRFRTLDEAKAEAERLDPMQWHTRTSRADWPASQD